MIVTSPACMHGLVKITGTLLHTIANYICHVIATGFLQYCYCCTYNKMQFQIKYRYKIIEGSIVLAAASILGPVFMLTTVVIKHSMSVRSL